MSLYDLREEFEAYINQRQQSYRKAADAPLWKGSLLRVASSSSFHYRDALGGKADYYLGCPGSIEPKDAEALLPVLCGDRRPRPAVYPDTTTTFSLVRPLQAGAGKWAQVWLASGCKEGDTSQVSDELVVVKLFQESLFPIPDLPDYATGFVSNSRAYAYKESWAYCALEKLQGTLLPYSLGFFTFVLPCGEIVCGHVMEFVAGRTLQRDYSSMRDRSYEREEYVQQRRRLIERFTLAVHLVHSLGVAHGDLSPRNVLLPSLPEGSLVILDWNQAQPAYTPYSIVASEWGGLRDCLEEIGTAYMVVTWASEQVRNGAAWTEMLGDSPKQVNRSLVVLGRCAAGVERKFQKRAEHMGEYLKAEQAGEGVEHEGADRRSEIEYEFPDGAFIPDTHGAW